MNNEVVSHLEKALNEVRTLFTEAATRIEGIKPGEKIPATQLAADLAKDHGMTGPALYPVLKILLDGYPGVDIRKGAHGGICRAPLPVAPPAPPVADTNAGEQEQKTSAQ